MKIYTEIEVEPLDVQYTLRVKDSIEIIGVQELSKKDLENLLEEYCNNMREYCGYSKSTLRGIE